MNSGLKLHPLSVALVPLGGNENNSSLRVERKNARIEAVALHV